MDRPYEVTRAFFESCFGERSEAAERAWKALPPPGADMRVADYVWLPFRFDGEMGYLDWRDEWSPAAFD